MSDLLKLVHLGSADGGRDDGPRTPSDAIAALANVAGIIGTPASVAGAQDGMVALARTRSDAAKKKASHDPTSAAESFHHALARWLADVAEGPFRNE